MTITTLTALVASIAAATSPAQPRHLAGIDRYTCAASQQLTVQPRSSGVSVQVGDRTYRLERKQSGLGKKYLSSTAALIIDGSSAVFVAEDRLDLGTCVKGSSAVTLR